MLRKKISNNDEGLSLSCTNGQATEISGLLCYRLIETRPTAQVQLSRKSVSYEIVLEQPVLFNEKVATMKTRR